MPAAWVHATIIVVSASLAAAFNIPEVVMRPNVYFGTRTVEEHPIMTGIAWRGAVDNGGDLRHSCRHEHKLEDWGWTAHDGRSFGYQTVRDKLNNVKLSMEWRKGEVKIDGAQCSPWIFRLNGTALGPKVDRKTHRKKAAKSVEASLSMFFYVSVPEGAVSVDAGLESTAAAVFSGGRNTTAGLQKWAAVISPGVNNTSPKTIHTHTTVWLGVSERTAEILGRPASLAAPDIYTMAKHLSANKVWDVDSEINKATTFSTRKTHLARLEAKTKAAGWKKEAGEGASTDQLVSIQADIDNIFTHTVVPTIATLGNSNVKKGKLPSNLAIVQFVVSLPFEYTFTFLPGDCLKQETHINTAADNAASQLLSKPALDFDATLCQRLQLCEVDGKFLPMARSAVANLIGSMTYFHGQQLVRQDDSTVKESAPHGLFTGVPSRSFFPRGFLWDEGFHQLINSRWDPAFAAASLRSWLETMDSDGWIAREQILGPESRSRVPEQFQVQRRDIANPPTIFLPVLTLLADALCENDGDLDVALRVDPAGIVGESSVTQFCAQRSRRSGCIYACVPRGRHTGALSAQDALALFSGLYPLLAKHYGWLQRSQAGKAADTFRWRGATPNHNFASGLDDFPRGVTPSDRDENVDLLSWMAMTARIMADFSLLAGDSTGNAAYRADFARYQARLDRYWNAENSTFCDIGLTSVDQSSDTSQVCHLGYVSLFPMLLRLLPIDSSELSSVMADIADPGKLWSRSGLRSLSKTDPLYGKDEDYWRQAVWININFLAVSSIRHYAAVSSVEANRAAWSDLADRLEANVLDTVSGEYARTGFLWENYDSDSGRGRGTHPFTGWTALVALMAAKTYPF